MDKKAQLNKLKRRLSALPSYKPMKKISFVNNDMISSITSSSELTKNEKQ
jgi:hypothetical protein